MKTLSRQHLEYIRSQAKRKFEPHRGTWCDLLRWAAPYRASWILSQTPGERKNQHIVDPYHLLSLRSSVAGFLEGNTSASRPWYRIGSRDAERSDDFEEKKWLQHFTNRTLAYLGMSNFYDAAGIFYYDYHSVNTGAHYFQELEEGGFHVHTLIPGSYYVINDSLGNANILVREFSLNVKSIVDTYGKVNKDGKADWSNISKNVKKMYQEGTYSEMIDIVQIVMPNPDYDIRNPNGPYTRKWLDISYEVGGSRSAFYSEGQEFGITPTDPSENEVYLRKITTRRKPFVVGKSTTTSEYGEKGPTLDSLGLIKSLNKKAINKDIALEQITQPALQGPASLRKSYISHAPNTFVPLDTKAMSGNQKLERIFDINPAIGALTQDVDELRRMIDKFYYADFLLFLMNNPKTRTAAETQAIVQEQERVIGPNLQSLGRTYNTPVLEYVMDYVLYEDPYLEPPPESLQGQSLKPEYISIFAQAQRAADLPAIDRYIGMINQVGQMDPRILQKANLDKLADLYEDRLYLPSGLNNPQDKVDAMREQAQAEAQRQMQLQETLPAVARAAKDMAAIQQ